MPARRFRSAARLLMALAIGSLSLSAFAASPVPLGIDLGGSGPVTPLPAPAAAQPLAPAATPAPAPRGGMRMVHDGQNDVHATGTVNSVDPAAHKVNITHQPIPQIGWPSMTMDFAVAPAVHLAAIKPGLKVNFSLVRQPDGMYAVQTIAPAGGGP